MVVSLGAISCTGLGGCLGCHAPFCLGQVGSFEVDASPLPQRTSEVCWVLCSQQLSWVKITVKLVKYSKASAWDCWVVWTGTSGSRLPVLGHLQTQKQTSKNETKNIKLGGKSGGDRGRIGKGGSGAPFDQPTSSDNKLRYSRLITASGYKGKRHRALARL